MRNHALAGMLVLALPLLGACDRGAGTGGPVQGTPQGPGTIDVGNADAEGPLTTESPAISIDVTYPQQGPGDFITVEVLTPRDRPYRSERFVLPPTGHVSMRIPILGTYISDYRMSGTWTVNVAYNHEQAPSLVQKFDILPAGATPR